MPKRILRFKSEHKHYQADACILWCFDERFSPALRRYISFCHLRHKDVIRVAGGAKSLSSPDDECERTFLLNQIKKSIKLHNPKKIVLMLHSDCGAYGGIKAFGGNEKREFRHHIAELRKAKKTLKKYLPGCPAIELIAVDFKGIWKI